MENMRVDNAGSTPSKHPVSAGGISMCVPGDGDESPLQVQVQERLQVRRHVSMPRQHT